MGERNVFEINFSRFIGIGIGIEDCYYNNNIVLGISILLPLFSIDIFCKKTNKNKWF